jgi:uncharacterized membrane protein YoaK (UPF0700 family)
MISKLSKWVWAAAWLLAFAAGAINVVGLLSVQHQGISHLTGNSSMLAASISALDGAATIHFAATIGSFVLGTVISGFIIQDSTLKLGRRYGVVLLLESVLLLLAIPLFQRGNNFGFYFAACACGLQNAMVSTYSGAVIRTTHVSGMFTDLGIFLGHTLRGVPVDSRRLWLCVLIISAFLSGGVAGAWAYRRVGFTALLMPACVTSAMCLAYEVYRFAGKRRTGSGNQGA